MKQIGKPTLIVAGCGIVILIAMALQVCWLSSSLESALDTAGSLQTRYIECEGDRLKLQTAVQTCNAEIESLSAEIHEAFGSKLITQRR